MQLPTAVSRKAARSANQDNGRSIKKADPYGCGDFNNERILERIWAKMNRSN
jgi:hypothetical protein